MALSNGKREQESRSELKALYDDYRKSLLNALCCQARLKTSRVVREVLDSILVTSSCGAIAAWSLWHAPQGQHVWIALAIVTAATALLRVALPAARDADHLRRLHGAYETLYEDLGEVVERVRIRQSLDLESVRLWSAAFKRMERAIQGTSATPSFSRSLTLRCEEEVNRRVPIRGFYMPQDRTWPADACGPEVRESRPSSPENLYREKCSCRPCLPDA